MWWLSGVFLWNFSSMAAKCFPLRSYLFVMYASICTAYSIAPTTLTASITLATTSTAPITPTTTSTAPMTSITKSTAPTTTSLASSTFVWMQLGIFLMTVALVATTITLAVFVVQKSAMHAVTSETPKKSSNFNHIPTWKEAYANSPNITWPIWKRRAILQQW